MDLLLSAYMWVLRIGLRSSALCDKCLYSENQLAGFYFILYCIFAFLSQGLTPGWLRICYSHQPGLEFQKSTCLCLPEHWD